MVAADFICSCILYFIVWCSEVYWVGVVIMDINFEAIIVGGLAGLIFATVWILLGGYR